MDAGIVGRRRAGDQRSCRGATLRRIRAIGLRSRTETGETSWLTNLERSCLTIVRLLFRVRAPRPDTVRLHGSPEDTAQDP